MYKVILMVYLLLTSST